jgi:hypothetical protein
MKFTNTNVYKRPKGRFSAEFQFPALQPLIPKMKMNVLIKYPFDAMVQIHVIQYEDFDFKQPIASNYVSIENSWLPNAFRKREVNKGPNYVPEPMACYVYNPSVMGEMACKRTVTTCAEIELPLTSYTGVECILVGSLRITMRYDNVYYGGNYGQVHVNSIDLFPVYD